jgi:hypothetical protein
VKRFTAFQNIPEPRTIEASFRPQYEYNWPEDLPTHCVLCGNEFRVSENLQFGPESASIKLRRTSLITLLSSIYILALVVAPLASLKIDNSHLSLAVFLIGALACISLAASPVMFFMSINAADARHLKCDKCSWSRIYPLQKTQLKASN